MWYFQGVRGVGVGGATSIASSYFRHFMHHQHKNSIKKCATGKWKTCVFFSPNIKKKLAVFSFRRSALFPKYDMIPIVRWGSGNFSQFLSAYFSYITTGFMKTSSI